MHSDDIMAGLAPVKVARIKALIGELRDLTSFRIKRTPEERQSLNAVDQGRAPFVDLGAEFTKDYHADLMIDADEVARTARINYDFKAMSEIETDLHSLFEGISDTTMQIGHNCYNTALVVKDLVGVAIRRRKPGMETLWDRMAKLFERGSQPKNDGGDNGNGGAPEAPQTA